MDSDNDEDNQMTQEELIDQLMKMLDQICLNAGYARFLENQMVLIDPQIYFDICQIIFSQHKIKLIKIQEEPGLTNGEKLDCLINLLINQLQIQMQGLSGQQIMRFNISHIYQFLHLLYEYSKLYIQRGSGSIRPRVKTQPPNQIHDDFQRNRNPYSARPLQNLKNKSPTQTDQRNGSSKKNYPPNGQSQKLPGGPGDQKQNESRQSNQKISQQDIQKKQTNLYDNLIKVMIDQKNRVNKASLRDQRKNKNNDIIQAKKKYESYLKSYSKQNRNAQKRKNMRKQSKKKVRQLPLRDFSHIQNFFNSFAYKFRDAKDIYIRRMQKEIRKKQIEKSCHRNRIERQTKHKIQKGIQQQVECLKNQHEIRTKQIKENSSQLQKSLSIIKREMKRKSSVQKQQLKKQKQRQLQTIQNYIRQENERLLMELEQGGRLDNLVANLYKKLG